MNLPESFGFPELNAALNGAAGVLLVFGYAAIKLRLVRLHIACMLSALVTSAVFLVSYLYYHFAVKAAVATSFKEQWPAAPDAVRSTYYAILLTHTALAAIVPVLAVLTAYLGLTGRFRSHVRLARWTLPIWLYVSITGVVVYWMLYRLYAS